MNTPISHGGFWLTNHVANPILRPLLRSRVGRRLGRRLAVVRYRGRRTGRVHELVVQYVRVDVSPTPGPGEATQEPRDPGTTDVDTGAWSS